MSGQLAGVHMLAIARAASGDFLAIAVKHDDRGLPIDVPEVSAVGHARRHKDKGEAEPENRAEKCERHGRARERAPEVPPSDPVARLFRVFGLFGVWVALFGLVPVDETGDLADRGFRAAFQIREQSKRDGAEPARVMRTLRLPGRWLLFFLFLLFVAHTNSRMHIWSRLIRRPTMRDYRMSVALQKRREMGAIAGLP